MKALALISGGLDSLLAAKFIQEQGIQVKGVKFKTPFSAKKKTHSFDIDLEFRELDISDEFLKLIKKPKHGFGAHLNPCIDCKILMLKKAKRLLKEEKAKFIITGEVLGQRPMSQHKKALEIIAKDCGLDGLILRPLSAKLLPKTIPEKKGWVKRENLLDFNGRSRKPQIKLAKKLQILKFQQPAGGCLLTDRQFSRRLKDLIEHNQLNLGAINILKIGRHFRISSVAKLVVGRNEEENKLLLGSAKGNDYLFYPHIEVAGPTSLGIGKFNRKLIELACAITYRYCDKDSPKAVEIFWHIGKGEEEKLTIADIGGEDLEKYRI